MPHRLAALAALTLTILAACAPAATPTVEPPKTQTATPAITPTVPAPMSLTPSQVTTEVATAESTEAGQEGTPIDAARLSELHMTSGIGFAMDEDGDGTPRTYDIVTDIPGLTFSGVEVSKLLDQFKKIPIQIADYDSVNHVVLGADHNNTTVRIEFRKIDEASIRRHTVFLSQAWGTGKEGYLFAFPEKAADGTIVYPIFTNTIMLDELTGRDINIVSRKLVALIESDLMVLSPNDLTQLLQGGSVGDLLNRIEWKSADKAGDSNRQASQLVHGTYNGNAY